MTLLIHARCCSILSGDIAALYAAVCELFEMYLLHTLRAFADVPIISIVSPTESQVNHSSRDLWSRRCDRRDPSSSVVLHA